MKFPVWRTTGDVFEFCWRERRLLLRFGLPPLALSIFLTFAATYAGLIGDQPSPTYIGLAAALQMLIYAPVTVTWYRITVVGESEAGNRALFSLQRREWRLIGWQIVILIGIICIAIVGGLLTGALAHLGGDGSSLWLTVINAVWTAGWFLTLLLIAMRFSMVMALIAMDQPVHLRTIWLMTGGISWRLLACTILLALGGIAIGVLFKLAGIFAGAVAAMTADSPMATFLKYFGLLGDNIVSFLTLIFAATLFGFVYKMLAAQTAGTRGEAPIAEPSAPASSGTSGTGKARTINAAIWLYLWLSGILVPSIVPEGGDFWAVKAKQLFQFGPFDDIPRLLGRGVWFFLPWLIIHLSLGKKKRAAPTALTPESPQNDGA